MAHVQKRLASTAAKLATVSTSHLKAFPPKEAVVLKPSSSKAKTEHTPNFFDAETWASLQPPNPASLSAFAHRIGLGKVLKTPAMIQQACTHPSFITLCEQHRPDKPLPQANGNLAYTGNALLGLFATEYVNSTYPFLPTRVMKAAVSAHVGPTTCANLAREIGVTPILRWQRTVSAHKMIVNSCCSSC